MKKHIIGIVIFLSSIYADIHTTPHYLSLDLKYHTIALKEDLYIATKGDTLSTDINGIAYFFPNFLLEGSQIHYFPLILEMPVDAFVFTSQTLDLCSFTSKHYINQQDIFKHETFYLRPQLLQKIYLESDDNANFWIYLYPKIKRDYISSSFFLIPIQAVFSFLFDQKKVDQFVQSKKLDFPVCNNPFSYLDQEGFDSLIKKMEKYLQEQNISIKYSQDFQTLAQMEEYASQVKEISQESDFKMDGLILYHKVYSAQKRFTETKNFCNYIEYLKTSPKYLERFNQPITITNSCAKKGSIEEYNQYVKSFITGYKVSGTFKKMGEALYIEKGPNELYKFTTTDGCHIQNHRVTDEDIIDLLSHREGIGTYIDIHDWDNDTDLKYDCLLATDDRAYKLDEIKGNKLVFKQVAYPIKDFEFTDIIVFDKDISQPLPPVEKTFFAESQDDSQSTSQSSSKSEEVSSSTTYEAISSSSTQSQSSQEQVVSSQETTQNSSSSLPNFPGEDELEESEYQPVEESFSSVSIDTNQSEINSTEPNASIPYEAKIAEQVVANLPEGEPNGFFLQL